MRTLADVAKRAGVSKTTVSRYLNGHFHQMSPETRERVREAIEALDYRPNLMAASIKTKRTRTIGVLVSNITNPFFSELVQAIEETAAEAGYSVVLASTGDDPEKEKQYVSILRERQVDGLIATTSGGNAELYRQLHESGFPIVLVDRLIPSLPLDAVLLNNEKGVRDVLQYLYRLGHRHMVAVTGRPAELTPRLERVQAFEAFVAEQRLPVSAEHVIVEAPNEAGGYRAALRLLAMATRPTAVLSTLNVMSLGLLQCFNDKGVRIPRDLSLITFDDVPWCKVVQPALTVVDQPVGDFGVHAVSLLLQRLEEARSGQGEPMAATIQAEVIRLTPTLIIRDSCAEPARPLKEAGEQSVSTT